MWPNCAPPRAGGSGKASRALFEYFLQEVARGDQILQALVADPGKVDEGAPSRTPTVPGHGSTRGAAHGQPVDLRTPGLAADSPAGSSRKKRRAFEGAGAERMNLVRRMSDERRQKSTHGSHDLPASASSGEETLTPGDTALGCAMGELVKVLARKGCVAAVYAPRRAEGAGRGGPENGPAYTDD